MADTRDMDKQDAVIFDVDGTLASTQWRDPMVRGPLKDWKNYHAGMSKDSGIYSTIRAARRAHARGEKVILLTLRPERYRPVIEKWMEEHQVPFDELYLRPEGDFRRGREVKRSIYKEQIKPRFNVRMAFDDFSEILSMWKEEKVPTTKVIDPGTPPNDSAPAADPRTLPGYYAGRGRVWVKGYVADRGGHPEYVSGYWREFG